MVGYNKRLRACGRDISPVASACLATTLLTFLLTDLEYQPQTPRSGSKKGSLLVHLFIQLFFEGSITASLIIQDATPHEL
jgi:hypothetical protein